MKSLSMALLWHTLPWQWHWHVQRGSSCWHTREGHTVPTQRGWQALPCTPELPHAAAPAELLESYIFFRLLFCFSKTAKNTPGAGFEALYLFSLEKLPRLCCTSPLLYHT